MPLSSPFAPLPEPNSEALAHSRRLVESIGAEIRAHGGCIGFDRYMELALYAPGSGYYMAGATKFGGAGDFVTAPERSPLFARMLARQVAQLLRRCGGGEVIEPGAGTGALAAGLLRGLEAEGAPWAGYAILEPSPELRARQRARLRAEIPHLADRVRWLDRLPGRFRGVVVANEVLDALPVRCFVQRNGDVRERCVGLDRQGRLGWTERPAQPRLRAAVDVCREAAGGAWPEGYTSEVCERLPAWVRSLAERLERGALLLIDYGYPRREYYHPQRIQGTLLCHYRHRAHDDPFLYPGLQDISANVDFTAVAEAADAAGLEVAGFTTQAQFLLALGIAQAVEEAEDEVERLRRSQEIQHLVLPSEMGDRFHAMLLTRGVSGPFAGFGLRDFRGRL